MINDVEQELKHIEQQQSKEYYSLQQAYIAVSGLYKKLHAMFKQLTAETDKAKGELYSLQTALLECNMRDREFLVKNPELRPHLEQACGAVAEQQMLNLSRKRSRNNSLGSIG